MAFAAVYVFWAILVCWKAKAGANVVTVATDTPHDTNDTRNPTVEEFGNDFWKNTTADVPYTPTNLRTYVVTSTTILLEWDPPVLPHGFVENYVVQWESKFSTGTGSTGGRDHHNITDLIPYTNYTVKVRLYNGDATGPWSEELVVKTGIGVPSFPTGLNVTENTEGSISLSWDFPVPDRGPILYFEVHWTDDDEFRSVYADTVPGTSTTYRIINLSPYTAYFIRVRAFSNARGGPWASVNGTTGIKGVPGRITQIIFDRVTATTIIFRFLGPHDEIGFPITQYVMTWQEVNDVLSYRKEWLKGTRYVVNGLIPGAKYNFSAAARNQLGEGPWLSTIYIMPEKTVPEPPRIRIEQEAVSDYPDRFEVRWGAPEDHGNPITEYEIRCSKVRRGVTGWWNVTESGLCLVRIPPQLSSYEITGLEPDSYYMIEIRAKSDAGYGNWASVVIKTATIGGCSDQYCFNGGLCKVDKGGNPVCYCKSQFSGERCQFGENLMILSREIILISVASVGLIVISLIAVCLLCYCVRSQKTSKT